MHYAMIKRELFKTKPYWLKNYIFYARHDGLSSIIKYEKFEVDGCFKKTYTNLIMDSENSEGFIDYYVGEIHHEPFNQGESINVNGESFTVEKIEKSIDGSYIYYVQPLSLKSDDYDELLKTAEHLYNTESNKKFNDLIDDALLRVKEEKVNKKKKWWKW